MYHCRFKNSHYEAGFHWGETLKKHGVLLNQQHTFTITEERRRFAKNCIPIYEKFYPEILNEIKGIADGQGMPDKELYTFLFSMYCFAFNNHCTCFACSDEQHILFGRNSDFLVALEKLYMNVIYKLDNVFAFNGNTTAFVQMEDGMNEHGLAVGLTFVYPKVREYGFNAGMLVRYILEKCKSVKEAIAFLKTVPIASQQTITMVDQSKNMVVVECNPYVVEVIEPNQDGQFVTTANNFTSQNMQAYKHEKGFDDWNSDERYAVSYTALKNQNNQFSLENAQNILSGKYGFMCQYDRTQGADTVWSVIYDVKHKKIYRVEGNPGRKTFKEDIR